MFKVHDARDRADVRKLLFAIIAVAAMVFAAFAVTASDESDALVLNPGKTYYFDQLNDLEKQIYTETLHADIVANNVPGHNDPADPAQYFGEYVAEVTIPLGDLKGQSVSMVSTTLSNAISKVMKLLDAERPDFFWYNSQFTSAAFSYSGDSVTSDDATFYITHVLTDYGITESEIIATWDNIRNAVTTTPLDSTDGRYNTVKSIHKAVLSKLSYCPEPIPADKSVRNVAKALLGDGVVVCEGYAKTFKLYCDQYNIPCVIVTGTAGTTGPKEAHMWNYVQMENGKWYLVDCTWDDQSTPVEDYLLAGTETEAVHFGNVKIKDSHTRSIGMLGITFPMVSETSYSSTEYDVIFYDEDATTIISSTKYQLGDTITVPANPAKAPTTTQVFTFKAWVIKGTSTEVSEFGTVTGDASYVATFNSEVRHYTVTFKDSADRGSTVLFTKNDYQYNDTLVAPANPADVKDEYFCYTFTQWNPSVPAKVTSDMEIVAQYAKVKNFVNDSGSLTVKSRGENITFNTADIAIIQASTGPLTIQMPQTTIVFDNVAAKALSAEETLKVDVKDFKGLNADAKEKLRNAVVYEIDFGTNNNVFTSGKATVTVKFTPYSGQSTSDIKLFYVNGAEVTEMSSTYADGKLTFETNHFSTFAIQIPEEKATDIISILKDNYILVLIVVFAILGMALSYKFS